jgi:hypothetical protein
MLSFSVWQLLRRSSKGTRRCKSGNTSRIRVGRYPRHPPGGRVSGRQRKWDRTYGHKQNQVKCASNEMRFDSGINLFFHLGLWLNVPRAVLAVDSLSFTKNHQEMSTQCFANFWVFSEGSAPRRNCGGTIRTDDVDCCGRRPPLRSPESREQKTIHRTESRFRRDSPGSS